MKTRFSALLLAVAALLVSAPIASNAQEPVSTGIVQGTVPAAGTLTLRSDQSSRPITFYGMDRANIFTSDGVPATVDALQVGQRVTVQYAIRGKRWYISKVLLPDSRAGRTAVTGAPVNVDPALMTPAATDGDITTQPGSRAAIDNDITTQPGSNRGVTNGRVPVRRRGP